MLRLKHVGVVSLFVGVLLALVTAPAGTVTQGSVVYTQTISSGLQINTAHVTTGVQFELQAQQAHGLVSSLQPVTNDCSNCAVAVNGDYFNETTRQPIGGVIIGGVVLRSPNVLQNQLTIARGGSISAGIMTWHGSLTASDGSSMPLAVNDPAAASPILFDQHYGQPTDPGSDVVELNFAPTGASLHLDQILSFVYAGPHAPGSLVPPGQLVLRGSGAFEAAVGALGQKLASHQLSLTVQVRLSTSPDARDSLGANHILLKDGQIQPILENDAFVNGPNPRTLFGWNADGQITLMTIGSAQTGSRAGVSLPAAAQILASNGIANAVNLDGGGSSTFVGHGQVLNHPSDGQERGVANAWVVVIKAAATPPPPVAPQPPVTASTATSIPTPESPVSTTQPPAPSTSLVTSTTRAAEVLPQPSRRPKLVAEPVSAPRPSFDRANRWWVLSLALVPVMVLLGLKRRRSA